MTPSIVRTLHQFLTITDLDLITKFDFLPNCARFPLNICNGCGMPTEDAYSSRHLVLSHFWTCMCSNVETNLSWTCLVSGLLNFEHPSVLFFLRHSCVPMHTNLFNILCFSCQGKSRDIVYQRTCLSSWFIFAKHGLFGIQLTVYSAPSRLTDHGIYYIIWCGIWLFIIFHIQYIHFQRELRKVTSLKLYLSFLLSIYLCCWFLAGLFFQFHVAEFPLTWSSNWNFCHIKSLHLKYIPSPFLPIIIIRVCPKFQVHSVCTRHTNFNNTFQEASAQRPLTTYKIVYYWSFFSIDGRLVLWLAETILTETSSCDCWIYILTKQESSNRSWRPLQIWAFLVRSVNKSTNTYILARFRSSYACCLKRFPFEALKRNELHIHIQHIVIMVNVILQVLCTVHFPEQLTDLRCSSGQTTWVIFTSPIYFWTKWRNLLQQGLLTYHLALTKVRIMIDKLIVHLCSSSDLCIIPSSDNE